jgi:hypothetical protein
MARISDTAIEPSVTPPRRPLAKQGFIRFAELGLRVSSRDTENVS